MVLSGAMAAQALRNYFISLCRPLPKSCKCPQLERDSVSLGPDPFRRQASRPTQTGLVTEHLASQKPRRPTALPHCLERRYPVTNTGRIERQSPEGY
jgi:hypothetical protein